MAWVSALMGMQRRSLLALGDLWGIYPTSPSPGFLYGISEATFADCSTIKTPIRLIRYSERTAGPAWRLGVFGGYPTSPSPGFLYGISEAALARAPKGKAPARGTC